MFTSYGHIIRSHNKIIDYLMILPWDCPFNVVNVDTSPSAQWVWYNYFRGGGAPFKYIIFRVISHEMNNWVKEML